jgi:hypothetical protein
LQQFRVLDPACGSGNFLLLTLLGLKDLEHQVITETEALGLGRQFPAIGPENLLGIEINPFAAELARVSLWIGEIQWMLNHGFALSRSRENWLNPPTWVEQVPEGCPTGHPGQKSLSGHHESRDPHPHGRDHWHGPVSPAPCPG